MCILSPFFMTLPGKSADNVDDKDLNQEVYGMIWLANPEEAFPNSDSDSDLLFWLEQIILCRMLLISNHGFCVKIYFPWKCSLFFEWLCEFHRWPKITGLCVLDVFFQIIQCSCNACVNFGETSWVLPLFVCITLAFLLIFTCITATSYWASHFEHALGRFSWVLTCTQLGILFFDDNFFLGAKLSAFF